MSLAGFFRNLGGSPELEIEEKIFNISAFSIGVFALVGTLLNYLIGLNLIVVGLSFIGSLVAFYLFYLSRYKFRFSSIFIVYYLSAIFLILGIMYFYNSGFSGTVPYLVLVLLNVFILVTPKKYQKHIAGSLYLFLFSLFLLQYIFPHWITPYNSNGEAAVDHMTTMFYSMGLTTYVTIYFRNRMSKDRQEIIKKSLEIENQSVQLKEKHEALENSLSQIKERNLYIETLLQELSHRVKNNLQLVISLLDMQILDEENKEKHSQVEETKNRLISIILVHQKLYGPNQRISIYIPEYIQELCESILSLYNGSNETKDGKEIIDYNIEPLELPVEKIISLGLICNEIITNSFKHGFINTDQPRLEIFFSYSDKYILKIRDNGNGFDLYKNKRRSGMSLMHSLTKQLKGGLEIKSEIGTGTTTILSFP